MLNKKLAEYIETEETEGFSEDELREFLLKKNYPAKEVEEAIAYANKKQKKTFTKRNPVVVGVLGYVTLGIYYIIWIVKTSNELQKQDFEVPNPKILWLLLIPIINIFVYFWHSYKYSQAVEEITKIPVAIMTATFIFLSPGAMALIQAKLNKP